MPASVVVAIWTTTSVVSCLGAVLLGSVAAHDRWVVARDHRSERLRVVRLETAGVLMRSGIVRFVTSALFVWAGFASHASSVTIGGALIGVGLSTMTAAMTVRDIVGRKRIADAS